MKLLYIPVFLITFSSFSQNFTPENSPMEFNGTLEYFRTVWFSSDNTSVYGDGKSIVGFDMNTGDKIVDVPIEGYCVHSSSQSGSGMFWIQGNSNYNNPNNPQITDMHNNLGCFDFGKNIMKAQKTGDISLSLLKYSSRNNVAYGISRKSNIESIIEFQVDPFKINRTIAKENSGNYILGLDVNENRGILAYSYAGNSKGIKFVELESGAMKKRLSINEEFSPLEFSTDGNALMAAAYNLLYKFDVATYESMKFNLDPENDKSYALSISVHPNNRSVSFSSKYGTSILDTENGTVKKIDKGQSMACKFSSDGKYLATSVKPFLTTESVCLRVFKDPRFEDTSAPPPLEEIEYVHEANGPEMEEFSPPPPPLEEEQWYRHTDANFSLDFPSKPKIETNKTDKGLISSKYTCLKQTAGYMAFINQMPKKIKSRKYKKTAEEMGRVFVAKINPPTNTKSAYYLSGQEGVKYRFVKDGLSYEYRCICINGYAYQIVSFNGGNNSEDENRFFNSFNPER